MQAQRRPVDEIVVVIDHNDALLARARVAFPAATVLANASAQGLSGARNTGIDASTGDIVCFLDDDAAAEPDWSTHLLAPYADPSSPRCRWRGHSRLGDRGTDLVAG